MQRYFYADGKRHDLDAVGDRVAIDARGSGRTDDLIRDKDRAAYRYGHHDADYQRSCSTRSAWQGIPFLLGLPGRR